MLHLTLNALECFLLWVFTRLKHPQAVVGCFSSVLFLQARSLLMKGLKGNGLKFTGLKGKGLKCKGLND